jgi:5-methylcytosine-specific restriction endonuclease McrA
MEGEADFWALRDSFLPPIPQLHEAARRVDLAADAVLSREYELARTLIRSCDMPELHTFRSEIVEGDKPHIHRYRVVLNAPPRQRGVKARMPSKATELSIFRRDGWRCRFCGIRIISLHAIKLLDKIFPDEVRWTAKPYKNRNVAFNVLASSLDHIVPHGRGGDNDPTNLVGACGSCQFGRMQYTLEEVGFTDPRARAPKVDSWDGLERLLLLRDV